MNVQRPFSVIGAGKMGRAIARAAASQGLAPSIWTRNHELGASLELEGLCFECDIVRVFPEGAVIVLLLSDYDVARQLIDRFQPELSGRVIVNLMTGTGAEAQRFSEFVRARGGAYLDGAIHAYPADVLNRTASISISGDEKDWEKVRIPLQNLSTGIQFAGEDVALPNTLDAIFAGAFHLVALGALFEAAAFANALGIPMATFAPAAHATAESLAKQISLGLQDIETGRYATDQATLSTYTAAARKWRAQMMATGQRASLSTANLHNLEIAEAAGYGEMSIAAQYLSAGINSSQN